MTYCGKKFGVRINGKLTWFATQVEAQKIEDEILWRAHRRAMAAGKKVILPVAVARRFESAATSPAKTDSSVN